MRFVVDEIKRKKQGTRKSTTLWAIWDWDRHAYVNSGTREECEREAALLNQAVSNPARGHRE